MIMRGKIRTGKVNRYLNAVIVGFGLVMVPVTGLADEGLKSSQERVESLETVLKNAKDIGVVRSDGEQRSASLTTNIVLEGHDSGSRHGAPTSELIGLTCDAFKSFDFGDNLLLKTYADGIGQLKQAASKPELAKTYLALGLAEEAMAVVQSDSSEQGVMLRIVSSQFVTMQYSLGSEYEAFESECGQSYPVFRALLGQHTFKQGLDAESERQLLQSLKTLPKPLMQRAARSFALQAIDAGRIAVARRILLKTSADEFDGSFARGADAGTLYMHAMLFTESPEDRNAKLRQVLDTDNQYTYRVLKALSKDSAQSSSFLEDSELHLNSATLLMEGQKSAVAAGVALAEIKLKEGKVKQAIQLLNRHAKHDESIYEKSVETIAEVIIQDLQGDDTARQLVALESYFYDTAFFEVGSNSAQLDEELVKTLIALNLPQVARTVLDFDTTDSIVQTRYQSLVNLSLKLQNSAPLSTKDIEDLRTLSAKQVVVGIRSALNRGDIDYARILAKTLPPGKEKTTSLQTIEAYDQNWEVLKALLTYHEEGDNGISSPGKSPDQVVTFLSRQHSASTKKNPALTLAMATRLSEAVQTDINHSRAYLNDG